MSFAKRKSNEETAAVQEREGIVYDDFAAEAYYWRRHYAGQLLSNVNPQTIADQAEAESIAARCVRVVDALLAELDK